MPILSSLVLGQFPLRLHLLEKTPPVYLYGSVLSNCVAVPLRAVALVFLEPKHWPPFPVLNLRDNQASGYVLITIIQCDRQCQRRGRGRAMRVIRTPVLEKTATARLTALSNKAQTSVYAIQPLSRENAVPVSQLTIIRSRVTFATMLAAAMQYSSPSPPITHSVSTSDNPGGVKLPSTSTNGFVPLGALPHNSKAHFYRT